MDATGIFTLLDKVPPPAGEAPSGASLTRPEGFFESAAKGLQNAAKLVQTYQTGFRNLGRQAAANRRDTEAESRMNMRLGQQAFDRNPTPSNWLSEHSLISGVPNGAFVLVGILGLVGMLAVLGKARK